MPKKNEKQMSVSTHKLPVPSTVSSDVFHETRTLYACESSEQVKETQRARVLQSLSSQITSKRIDAQPPHTNTAHGLNFTRW